jgi:superfamily I DNA/RNA helicase
MTRTWSPQQIAVFDWFATGRGHLVVRARAGTGKTTTIVEGVSRAPEKAILLAAFNKEIAKELQARVGSSKVEVKTLHALGLRYIKRNWIVEVEDPDHAGERALSLVKRVIPNAPDRVQKLVGRLHTKTRELYPFASSEKIDDVAAQFDILPDDEMEEQGWPLEACSNAAYDAMELAKQKTAPLVKVCMALLKLGKRARVRGRDVGRGVIVLIRKLRARTIADIEPALNVWLQRETSKAQKLSDEAREARIVFVGDQAEIVLALCEGAATVSELETRVNELFSDDASRGAILCSTVHRVKGLEAERTFLLEGTFRPDDGESEEANIMYVAITRAKSRLCWVTGFE